MAIETKLLTFTANTGAGDQDLTGTSFTPKGVIVWFQRSLNAVDTFVENANLGIGMTDGTRTFCASGVSEDNQGTSDTFDSIRDDALIYCPNPTGTLSTIDAVATFVSFLSNGMRINWSNPPAAAFKIHVLFLGGADLTNVHVNSFQTNTATGPQSITSPGFQPDCTLFFWGFDDVVPSDNTHWAIGMGAATDSTHEWAQVVVTETGRPTTDTWNRYAHDRCIILNQGSTGALVVDADFTQHTSTGFDINIDTNADASARFVFYMSLKGGSYSVGNDTEPGSTGDQTITTNTDVKAVMILGVDSGTPSADNADMMWTMGAGTSNSEMECSTLHDTDAAGTSISTERYETDSIYLNMTSNATAGSSTIDDEASLSSVSSSNFVLNWSNIGQARPFRYWTIGNTAVAGAAAPEERRRALGNKIIQAGIGGSKQAVILG